jgi:hypothetical protein
VLSAQLKRLEEALEIAGDRPDMADFTSFTGLGDGDIDRVLVDIETD